MSVRGMVPLLILVLCSMFFLEVFYEKTFLLIFLAVLAFFIYKAAKNEAHKGSNTNSAPRKKFGKNKTSSNPLNSIKNKVTNNNNTTQSNYGHGRDTQHRGGRRMPTRRRGR